MKCEVAVTVDNIAIVASSTKSMAHLMPRKTRIRISTFQSQREFGVLLKT